MPRAFESNFDSSQFVRFSSVACQRTPGDRCQPANTRVKPDLSGGWPGASTARMFLNLANPECLVPHPNVERKQAD